MRDELSAYNINIPLNIKLLLKNAYHTVSQKYLLDKHTLNNKRKTTTNIAFSANHCTLKE